MDNRINFTSNYSSSHQETIESSSRVTNNSTLIPSKRGANDTPISPNKKTKRHKDIGIRQEMPLDPQLRWLTQNKHHTNVVVPVDSFTDARHLFQKILEKDKKTVLYIHNMDALDDLKSSIEIREGQLTSVDGPFVKLLNSGGVIMLNVANFSPQQLEAFNTLMEENKWEGKELKNPVRILCLCDTETLKKNLLSGAQISRTAFQNMADYQFEKADRQSPDEPKDSYPEGTKFIDLQHDPMWSQKLLGGAIDE